MGYGMNAATILEVSDTAGFGRIISTAVKQRFIDMVTKCDHNDRVQRRGY
jgi:hypothetical protein